jgi:hypothetical protein
MTKKLILASLIGLTAVAASAPTYAATGSYWAQQLQERGIQRDPYVLPSEQLRRIDRNLNDD